MTEVIIGGISYVPKQEVKKFKIKWTKIGDLEWSDNLGEMTWDEAMAKCEEFGGRLPTRTELVDLVDNPINREKTKDWEKYNAYWSSTQYYGTPSYAWYVGLSHGFTYANVKTTRSYVRCVRRP